MNPFGDMLNALLVGPQAVQRLPQNYQNWKDRLGLGILNTVGGLPGTLAAAAHPTALKNDPNAPMPPANPGAPVFGPPPPIPGQRPMPTAGSSPANPAIGENPSPATNAPVGSARTSGPPSSPSGNAATSTPGQIGANPQAGNMIRYPTQNPQFALQSALIDMGANPFRADPYMSLLRNNAQGLATSFMLKNLGTTPDQMSSAGGEGNMFGSFLRSVLGQNSGISSALSSAASGMPGYLQQLTALQDQMAGSGQSLNEVNPFAQYIMDAMGDPGGAAGLYASLTTPFMSSKTGQSYLGGLQDVAGMALRRRANDLNQSGAPRNFWDYLFPGL